MKCAEFGNVQILSSNTAMLKHKQQQLMLQHMTALRVRSVTENPHYKYIFDKKSALDYS